VGRKSNRRKIIRRLPLNITIFYDKKYFGGAAHQQILKKMGFVK